MLPNFLVLKKVSNFLEQIIKHVIMQFIVLSYDLFVILPSKTLFHSFLLLKLEDNLLRDYVCLIEFIITFV